MAIKKAIYNVDNGSGFDEIHFKTSEDMIEGAMQVVSRNGYRKFPGGMVIQWGWVRILERVGYATFNFSVSFPGTCLSVVTSPMYSSDAGVTNIITPAEPSSSGCTIYIRTKDGVAPIVPVYAFYIAIGY